MSRIDEIKERLSKIDPNMKVYKCDSYLMDKDEACGIYEGQYLDCSYDECHHPLSHNLADYIVNTPADIQYLLSKLEIAEKVLEKISIPMPGSRDNELVKYYEREAGKALQQIRS